MEERPTALIRVPHVRIGLAVALALIAGLVTWILLSRDDETTTAVTSTPTAASVEELQALPGEVGHPVYWAGPQDGSSYELTRTADGRIYVRYLPHGVEVGDRRPRFLTVGTYPLANALAKTRAAGKRDGTEQFALSGGGVAVFDRDRPSSVYLAYPGSAVQIEVYDPSAQTARELVESSTVRPIGTPGPTAATARAVTLAELRALPALVGHPVYWAGPAAGRRYELTRTSDGRVYVRYLPTGVTAGDRRARFLTVGTYPRADALAATKAAGAQEGAVLLSLPGRGVAVFSRARPTSVYLAYPGSPFQVEVFDPSARTARRLVETGRIRRIG